MQKNIQLVQKFTFIFLCLFYLPLFGSEHFPDIQIFNSPEELGKACAQRMADLICLNQSQGRPTILGLATGSTPIPVYKAFKEIAKEEDLDLSQVVTFNLDEYCGLPRSDPRSYYSFMFIHFFNDLLCSPDNPKGLRQENIHIPNGYAKKEEDLSAQELSMLRQQFPRKTTTFLTKEEEYWILNQRAKEYENLIRECGPINFQILGIGTNGHIGFAEPGSSLEGRTIVVELSENTRKDNARFFDDKTEDVPLYAMTMGIGTILEADQIILLASGEKKADIIEKVLSHSVSPELPATALHLNPNVSFFLDVQAASDIGRKKICRYYNARIVRNHELIESELWTANGKIIPPQDKADDEVNVQGFIIAPGYIDLQINGGFGVDFSTNADQVKYVARLLPQYGVTSFLPTLISLKKEQYSKLLPYLQPSLGGAQGATILGIHLEGPFFASSKYGAHDKSLIKPLNESIEDYYGDLIGVKIVTLAPEIPGALAAIHYLKGKNIIVSAGHTNATFEEATSAIDAGVSMATHLFNAMTPLNHRAPGIVGAVLTNDSIFYSIIADSIHLNPSIINLAWRANPNGLFLVTDAMEALGQPPGIYHLGKMDVEVRGRGAYILGTETIAGSILSMDEAVRYFRESTHCSLVEAIEAASLKPAQVMGIQDHKGNLNEGADADFIILDDHLNVYACYISGQLAWQKSASNFLTFFEGRQK
jgi:N-acetylglucosamine-6-phosphate deacetylase